MIRAGDHHRLSGSSQREQSAYPCLDRSRRITCQKRTRMCHVVGEVREEPLRVWPDPSGDAHLALRGGWQ